MAHPPARSRRLPAGIRAPGFVSLPMDISPEMIHSLLPVFMVATLGVGMPTAGAIEGLAAATALALEGLASMYRHPPKPPLRQG